MARPQTQRYVEPDEIYDDLQPGAPTSIPPQFPYTWTPVNGLGDVRSRAIVLRQLAQSGQRIAGLGADATATSNPISDIFTSIINSGVQSGEDQTSQEVQDFLNNTPAGRALLDKVKSKAAEGVTDVVKKNAPNLIMLAVAGGAVGGALSAKMGKMGTLAALAVAGWAALQLMNAGATTPSK